jgi:phosphohistidine phosphatase
MDLILWRHAEAEDGMPDIARPLTAKGEKQASKMAAFLRTRLPIETRILASPAKRTQQTALALTKHFEIKAGIAPGATPQSLLKAAGWPGEKGCVLIVGHQPTLGQVVELLLGCVSSSFSIKKGAVWWLRYHEDDINNQADLRLVISPDFL